MVDVRVGDIEASLSWDEWERWVREGRVPPDASVRMDAVSGDTFVRADSLESYHDLTARGATARRRSTLNATPPLLTALLVGIQVRIWWFTSFTAVERWVTRDGVNFAAPILEDGQSWRLLTMGLLHLDLGHILLNMLWLAYTGSALERTLGRLNLLTLYVVSVLGGSLLSMWFKPETSSLGASGGVFGLIAAVTVFGFTRPELLPARARRVFGLAMLPYLVLMFASGLTSPNTDNWAHFGGLLAGGVLAFFLAPPTSRQARSTNAVIASGVATLTAVTLVVLSVLGPRIAPIAEHEVVQARQPRSRSGGRPPSSNARLSDAEETWSAPLGWRQTALPSGLLGFMSPSPAVRDRGFAVRRTDHDAPVGLSDTLDAFRTSLTRSGSEVSEHPAEVVTLAGYDATHVRFDVGPRQVDWYGVVRGYQTLEAVWETGRGDAEHTAPLRDRLLARVQWNLPTALTEATERVERNPQAREGRLALARALAQTGSAEQALATLNGLLADQPSFADAHTERILLVARYPELGIDTDALYDEALSQVPTAAVALTVADALAQQGDTAGQVGLLEQAWHQNPGDRALGRALRRADRSRDLHPERLIPLWRLADARGVVISDAEVAPPPDVLTVADARVTGEQLLAVRDERCRGIADNERFVSPEGAASDLLWLQLGYRPDAPSAEQYATLDRELLAALDGRAPMWACPALVSVLPESDVIDWLDAQQGPAP